MFLVLKVLLSKNGHKTQLFLLIQVVFMHASSTYIVTLLGLVGSDVYFFPKRQREYLGLTQRFSRVVRRTFLHRDSAITPLRRPLVTVAVFVYTESNYGG